MRKFLFFLLFSFLLGYSFSYDYSHIKVVEVIDGDTVKLENGKILRYIGIDAPETRKKIKEKWTYNPAPFAEEAKEYNKKLVEGKYIRVDFDVKKIDEYGRLLGYVFVDNTFVNAKLLEEGLAVLYTRPPNVKYVDLFVKLQKKARQEEKGLWGNCKVIDASSAYKFIGQIRTVRGRVLSTYRSQNCIFLNFGKEWRKDFTVVIFKENWDYFKRKGIDPVVFYKNKMVEVTGRIREYNGPEIIVNLPEEIIILDRN